MPGELQPFSKAELFESVPCGIVVTDDKGTILEANETFCGWIAADPAELLGKKKLRDLFTMGGRIFHQTHWLPSLQMQGSLAEVKFDVRRADGGVLPMMLNAVRRQHGGAAYDIITATVAEERNRYERELLIARKRADELVERERAAQHVLEVAQAQTTQLRELAEDRALFAEQMIGIVSHDLRNPLSAILMGAKILDRDEAVTPERRTKLVKTINSSARSARRLIEDLLDFTLARVGRQLNVVRQPGDFHALVARTVESLALAFPARTLRHIATGAGQSLADGDRIAQLLGNLVGNAMAYGDREQQVTVTSDVSSSAVTLSVHNFGEPIPEGMLATMFEPMVRGGNGDFARRSVGLGLYIVRAIAAAHDGAVTVESTPTRGTTFTFRFGREPGGVTAGLGEEAKSQPRRDSE
jgi:sigma-B regulation protein RsbU (phosphoserine phosphatase)